MRRIEIMDVIRVLQELREGVSDREVARRIGVSRRTVSKYRVWAEENGLLEGPLPPVEVLEQLRRESFGQPLPPQNQSNIGEYAPLVDKLRAAGVEVAAIQHRLAERGFTGSYWTVYRYVRRQEGSRQDVTVRVERQPGEEAQVDFGYAGRMLDETTGQERRAWAFVMTLSWSRHQYVEFVWNQTVATWLRCHRNALRFFGGVPAQIVLDNLKAGVRQACWEEPQAQLAYLECAEHYGFRIAPHRPRTPQHKGKVEQGGVHYVKRNFLGGRELGSLRQANADVRRWCQETAGGRVHGTTREQPLARFTETEQGALQPLPATPYDLAVWKRVKLHRDCHVLFEYAYYSAPFRLVGQTLYARGGSRELRLYTSDYQLVATHDRVGPGQRSTHPDHLPAEKLPGLYQNREVCQARAEEIGPATTQLVAVLLAERVDRLPVARRLLRLAERHDQARLEAACERALRFDDPNYRTVKRILELGQETAPVPAYASAPPARRFVRSAGEILGQFLGGLSWN
jgi:transposase